MKLSLILSLIPFFLLAQEIPNTINVRASSNIFVPADQVKINITISKMDADPRNAYREHKVLEAKLLELIKKHNIPDSLIVYSLPSFRPEYSTREQPPKFQTSQQVMIRMKSIEDYTEFQLELFENGFYNFGASFMTERIDEQKKQGYDAALKLAVTDAGLIAKAMGKELGDIVMISVTTTDYPYVDGSTSQAGSVYIRGRDMTAINQSIQIRTDINVNFKIED